MEKPSYFERKLRSWQNKALARNDLFNYGKPISSEEDKIIRAVRNPCDGEQIYAVSVLIGRTPFAIWNRYWKICLG